MPSTLAPRSVARACAEFAAGRDYLAACTVGLPTRASRAALVADLDAASAGRPDVAAYTRAVERSRAFAARILGTAPDRVAIGSQASTGAALLASALPAGAEVLVPEGEFSSIVLPFVYAPQGLRVRTAPLASLADEVGPRTALVAFSLVQSSTGAIADADAIVAATRAHGALTLCDATQAAGWRRVDAERFDATICHAYKWLCAPRGVAFLALAPSLQRDLSPAHAGWYAGADPWASCYGPDAVLASDARRFDVSPAWQAFVGAAPALELFASLDPDETAAHCGRLARRFRETLGLDDDPTSSAIVTWLDPDGGDLALLTAAGITASGRAGRARVAFHVFNDDDDVDHALAALGA